MVTIRDYINLIEHKGSYRTQLLSTVYAYPITESALLEDFGLGELWDGLKKLLGDAANWVWDQIKGLVSNVINILPNVPRYIVDGAVNFVMWCAVHPIEVVLGTLGLRYPEISSEVIKDASALITHAFGGDAGARGQLAMGGIEALLANRIPIPGSGLFGFLDGARKNFRFKESENVVWTNVLDAMENINNWVQGVITPEAIRSIAQFAVTFAVPAVFIAAIIYGGQMLYDFMSKHNPPESTKEKLSHAISKDAEPQTATESMRYLINKVDPIR